MLFLLEVEPSLNTITTNKFINLHSCAPVRTNSDFLISTVIVVALLNNLKEQENVVNIHS